MIDKAKVLALYDSSIDSVKIYSNPLIHHSSALDVEKYGAAMEERIIAQRCKTVLDIGCGTGNPLAYVREEVRRAIDYTGLDLNPRFVEICRGRWQDYPNFRFEQYDISECKLARSYDVIFVNETFAYFNSAEICAMIDYYVDRADKLFSASLLMPRERPASLLIEQTEVAPIVNHVLAKFPHSIVNRATYPARLRIDIFKE